MKRKLAIWVGGFALLAATLIDLLAVIGRHVGLPLAGSIELMQSMIVISGATGILIATMDSSHARVRILVDRFRPGWRASADRWSDLLSLVFLLALLIGSAWIAIDLWGGHEQSELLGVPWRLLRLFANACLAATILVLALRIFRSRSR